jgi:hypothetical protein
LGIKKQQLNLIFYTNNKIGFVKQSEKTVAQSFCDAGTSSISDISVDPNTPGIIFAAVDRGEILIFDAVLKGDNVDCRLKGKLFTKHSENPADFNKRIKL